LSDRINAKTRKIMNYTRINRSQKKFWWKISNNADVQIACQS